MRLSLEEIRATVKREQARPLLSVVIPTYNRSLMLETCLTAFIPQVQAAGAGRVEILVVDNRSRDDTQSMVTQWADRHPFVRYHKRDQPADPARAIIEAARLARGRYIWPFGDDDQVAPDGLAALLSLLGGDAWDFLLLNREVRDAALAKTVQNRLNQLTGDVVFDRMADLGRAFGFYSQLDSPAASVFRRELFLAADHEAHLALGDRYAHVGLLFEAFHDRPARVVSSPLFIQRLARRDDADPRQRPQLLALPMVRTMKRLKEKGVWELDRLEQIIEADFSGPPAALAERMAAAFHRAVLSGQEYSKEEWDDALRTAASWRYSQNVQAMIRALLIQVERMLAKDRIQEAEALVELAAGGVFHSAEGYYLKGRMHMNKGALEAAALLFGRAVEINPQLAEAYHLAGRALWRLDRREDARGALERGKLVDPNHLDMGLLLADVLAAMDQKDRAVLEYRRLIQLWPRDPRPQGKLGSVLLAMDRLDEAEKMLRTALDLGPKTPGVHQTLGVLFWRKGDRASAITHLERETDLAPGDRSLWANLKAMYEAEGRAEDVRRIEERLAIQHEVSGTGTMIRSMDQGGGA